MCVVHIAKFKIHYKRVCETYIFEFPATVGKAPPILAQSKKEKLLIILHALLFDIYIIRLIHFECWVGLSGWRWVFIIPPALAQLSVRHHNMVRCQRNISESVFFAKPLVQSVPRDF